MTNPINNRFNRELRRVVCSAVKSGENMILGPRHFDTVMQVQMRHIHLFNVSSAKQGFIDQWGKFMSREEAFDVATAAGQIIQKTGNPDSKELFSEDIY